MEVYRNLKRRQGRARAGKGVLAYFQAPSLFRRLFDLGLARLPAVVAMQPNVLPLSLSNAYRELSRPGAEPASDLDESSVGWGTASGVPQERPELSTAH